MPPKGKKVSQWQICDTCESVLNQKDIDIHMEFCPPPVEDWPHSYIKDKILHSYLEDVDVKCLPNFLNNELAENIVFLSQSAMQLCDLEIGSPVKLTMNGRTTIKKAWPTGEGSLTTVRAVKDSLEFGWNCKLVKSHVQVSILPHTQPMYIAKEIYYRIKDSDESYSKSEMFNYLLISKTLGQIFYSGFHIKIPFYGRNITVELVRHTPCFFGDEDLESNFKALDLNEHIFAPTENTVWKHVTDSVKDPIDCEIPKKRFVIGGYNLLFAELKNNILASLNNNVFKDNSSYGMLIYGIHGVGKTMIANYLASEASLRKFDIEGAEVFSKYYGETESRLRRVFELATSNVPCMLFIENIEILCPKKGTDQERRVVATLLSLFDSIRDKKIIVIATTSRPDDIEPSLRRPGRLEMEVEVPVPDTSDRFSILKVLMGVALEPSMNEALAVVADSTHGFVAADLSSLITNAACKAALENRISINKDDLFWAQTQVKPSAMREVYVQVPNVKWDDIGGQDELKLKLQQAVEWPLKYSESFTRLGIKPPRGVLMFGPPGCSKTLIAKALATETNLNFLSVKGSDIFSKWVGESEQAVRNLFKRARNVAPAIIFFDEIDAIGSERDESSGGGAAVQERVLSQILTEMDGVQALENVVVIAATNRPDRIDKALLRPGRLDRLIYVPLPCRDTRSKIFKINLKKMPIDHSVDLNILADKTEGYSGAEVVAVCNEAALKALEENLKATNVKMEHFFQALTIVTPRTPQSLIKIYEDYLNKC